MAGSALSGGSPQNSRHSRNHRQIEPIVGPGGGDSYPEEGFHKMGDHSRDEADDKQLHGSLLGLPEAAHPGDGKGCQYRKVGEQTKSDSAGWTGLGRPATAGLDRVRRAFDGSGSRVFYN